MRTRLAKVVEWLEAAGLIPKAFKEDDVFVTETGEVKTLMELRREEIPSLWMPREDALIPMFMNRGWRFVKQTRGRAVLVSLHPDGAVYEGTGTTDAEALFTMLENLAGAH